MDIVEAWVPFVRMSTAEASENASRAKCQQEKQVGARRSENRVSAVSECVRVNIDDNWNSVQLGKRKGRQVETRTSGERVTVGTVVCREENVRKRISLQVRNKLRKRREDKDVLENRRCMW